MGVEPLWGAAQEVVEMAFAIEGDYFEACSCTVSCPCVFLAPATEEACDAFLAWHITKGEKDGVDLAGLNAALAVHSPRQMTDGNWTVELFLDERAEPPQAEALGAIFSGQAGGHLANLAPLIGTVAGVNSAPITFAGSHGQRGVSVGDVLSMSVAEVVGMDGTSSSVITNPLLGAVTQPLRQARSTEVRFNGTWSFETSDRNSFITEFRYEG
jgi:hypothetical protein